MLIVVFNVIVKWLFEMLKWFLAWFKICENTWVYTMDVYDGW